MIKVTRKNGITSIVGFAEYLKLIDDDQVSFAEPVEGENKYCVVEQTFNYNEIEDRYKTIAWLVPSSVFMVSELGKGLEIEETAVLLSTEEVKTAMAYCYEGEFKNGKWEEKVYTVFHLSKTTPLDSQLIFDGYRIITREQLSVEYLNEVKSKFEKNKQREEKRLAHEKEMDQECLKHELKKKLSDNQKERLRRLFGIDLDS